MSNFTDEQLAYMRAHFDDTRVPDLYWIYCSAIVVAVTSTTLRVLAKRYTRNGIALDDYLAIMACICICGDSVVNFITGIPYGLGRHIIAVKSQEDLELILKGEFVFTQINTWSVCFVKLTILAFYYQVFPIPNFQRVVIGTFAFVTAWSFGCWGVTTFGCTPISKWWVPEGPGSCINLIPFGIMANLLNILTDLFIFVIPLPMLWKLRVSLAKRLALCGIFSLGFATCVVTILRTVRIFRIQSADFTWDNVPLSAYYVFEPVGGLLCINIPLVARAVRRKWKGHQESNPSNQSRPSDGPSETAPRQRRGSRWLRGIDSIQLSGMSSMRRSTVDNNLEGGRWRQLPRTSEQDPELADPSTPTLVETVLRKPQTSFYWDDSPLQSEGFVPLNSGETKLKEGG
ncbi:hypothetical protein EJ04DRAFT_580751 [Polyplosphaeria fusca]|uniref:Rhodopsin domain-containing protein n=1 Tax=Polyplosphaeria fusca TaxID=682080 RepID=A0A9P4QMV6_9PLEO|nr:hypothetical protein EJ04DRAFT_580751 [Polyplosphaeria fusca]